MKWLLIAALWNTNPPQDSFKFFTETFESKEQCEAALQYLYAKAFDKGVQAQARCYSEQELKLLRPSW